MAVEVALGVELQQARMYGATYLEHLVGSETCNAGALGGGSARIYYQRTESRTGLAQHLEGYHRVLATTDGDEVFIGIGVEINGAQGVVAFADYLHKILLRGGDAVDVEKLSQAVEIELFPKLQLLLPHGEGFYHHFGRTNAFPIAYQLYHTHLEHQSVVLPLRQPAEIDKRAAGDQRLGFEHYVAAGSETVADKQAAVGYGVLERLVAENGVLLP